MQRHGQALDRYLVARQRLAATDRALFVSVVGRPLPYNTVRGVFLQLLDRTNLRGAHSGRDPRIHDLRHTFAVRSLEQCRHDRAAVARHIVALSTYLGHAHVTDTYWYLQATPVLMNQIAEAGEALLTGRCRMTALAPYLSGFLREHLPKERRASQHTCEAYAQSFQLLLGFAASRLKITPAKIEIEQLDAPLILAFLEHLEKKRGNSARTRNARLAAINSFFRFLEYRLPSCLDQSRRIHAIPMKKTDQALVGYLTRDELQALLDAPDASTVSGIRDRAMLHLAFAAGIARVGAGRSPARSDRPPDHVQRAHHRQGAPRACLAALEGDGRRGEGCGSKCALPAALLSCSSTHGPRR